MPKKQRERKRVKKLGETEPRTVEKKSGKQTKFIIDAGDIKVTAAELEKMRSALLKSAVLTLKNAKTSKGKPAEAPQIGIEMFSMSFSLSFSLGA